MSTIAVPARPRRGERPLGPLLVAPAVAAVVILGALGSGIVAGDAPLLAVAGAGALLLGVTMIVRPDAATLVTLAILYSNAAVVLVRFHGLPFIVGTAVPLLLVVPLTRDLIVRRQPVVAPPMVQWMVVLLFIHVVSALFSINPIRAFDGVVVFIVEGFGLYFALINVVRTPEVLRQATWVLLAVGAFIGLLAVHQDLTNNYGSNYFGFAQPADAAVRTGEVTLLGEVTQQRLTGPIGETNRFAQVMLMLVPLGIYRAISEPNRLLRLLAAAITVVITLGVVLSFSRGAAVGLGALVLALGILRLVRVQHVVVLALALVVLFTAFPQYWNRVASLEELTSLFGQDTGTAQVSNVFLSRATETLAAALAIVDHPLVGVGPDMFPIYYEEYAREVGLLVHLGRTREAHNLFMGLGADIGLLGLGAFLIVALLTFRLIVVARRRSIVRRPDLERLTTPFGLSLMTYFVTGMFLHLSFARFYWLMLAVAGAAALITLREMAREDAAAPPAVDREESKRSRRGDGSVVEGRADALGQGVYSQSV